MHKTDFLGKIKVYILHLFYNHLNHWLFLLPSALHIVPYYAFPKNMTGDWIDKESIC